MPKRSHVLNTVKLRNLNFIFQRIFVLVSMIVKAGDSREHGRWSPSQEGDDVDSLHQKAPNSVKPLFRIQEVRGHQVQYSLSKNFSSISKTSKLEENACKENNTKINACSMQCIDTQIRPIFTTPSTS